MYLVHKAKLLSQVEALPTIRQPCLIVLSVAHKTKPFDFSRSSSTFAAAHTVRAQVCSLLVLPPRLHQARNRLAQKCQYHAKECCTEMPEHNDRRPNAPRSEELEELIDLVEIVLRLDIVLS